MRSALPAAAACLPVCVPGSTSAVRSSLPHSVLSAGAYVFVVKASTPAGGPGSRCCLRCPTPAAGPLPGRRDLSAGCPHGFRIALSPPVGNTIPTGPSSLSQMKVAVSVGAVTLCWFPELSKLHCVIAAHMPSNRQHSGGHRLAKLYGPHDLDRMLCAHFLYHPAL
jgi:hypothetical protein